MKYFILTLFALAIGNSNSTAQKSSDFIGRWTMQASPQISITFVLSKTNELELIEGNRTITGNWEYNAETKILHFTSPERPGDPLDLEVVSASKKEITIKDVRMGMDLVLTKSKGKPSKTATATKKVKPLSAAKTRTAVIGVWNMHSTAMLGKIPEGTKIQLTINTDGSASFSATESPTTYKWELSEDAKIITFLYTDTDMTEVNEVYMPDKNVLVLKASNFETVWLREGAKEPKNMHQIENTTNQIDPYVEQPQEEIVASKHENYKKIQGTWQLVQIDLDDLTEENRMVSFEKEHQIITTENDGSETPGKWKMSMDGSSIQISEDDYYNYFGTEIFIEEITADTLKLNDQGQIMTLKRIK